ncbi:hypothetical protein [Bacillus thuringiensis]|uniref:hypothetical protein n=1 Tax=Bacillus thuringiensis TaxID=1428 RepID=UPI000BFC51F4|nr:hypothetical protein [Bacillus thuringiensis]PGT89849.1 hypothetical protein COD17_08860 [Bacillus thuringiensis]
MEFSLMNTADAFAGYNRTVVFSNELREGVLWMEFACQLDGEEDKERRITVDMQEICKVVKVVKELGTDGSVILLSDSFTTYTNNNNRVKVQYEDGDDKEVFVLDVDSDCKLHFEVEKLLTVLNAFE